MAKKEIMKISEESKIQMPFKTVLSLIAIVAVGTMSYFGIQEKINQHSTRLDLMEKDLELNTEFRIKWPRGQMGSLPADQEQFLLIESILKDIEKINKALETGMHNNVNISRLQKDMDKVQKDIEKLKDSDREMHYKNGR
jgi:DNA relaxase NicK|tara:strand:+ start:320 stop:739 length:420 start_codon:yes stop_codon:yes gene_type:complete